jgi:CHAT domain-containing protein
MIKKFLILLYFFLIATSASSKTYEQKFMDVEKLLKKKNYEEAKSILLLLIKDLDKPNIKDDKRVLLFRSLEKITGIYTINLDFVNLEKYLIIYLNQCKILSEKKPNLKLFYDEPEIICQWIEDKVGKIYLATNPEKGVKIFENLINKEKNSYNNSAVKTHDQTFKIGRRIDLYDYYRRANKNEIAEKYIYEILSFIKLEDIKSKRENYQNLLTVYEFFANAQGTGQKREEAIKGVKEIIKDLKDQGKEDSIIYVNSLSKMSDILLNDYNFIDGTGPILKPLIDESIKLLDEAAKIKEKNNFLSAEALYYRLGIRHSQLFQFPEAKNFFYKSIKEIIAEKNQYYNYLAIGKVNIYLDKFSEAESNFAKAENIYLKYYPEDFPAQVELYLAYLDLYSKKKFKNISKFTDYYIKYYDYVSKKNKNLFFLSDHRKWGFSKFTSPLFQWYFRNFNDEEIKKISNRFKIKKNQNIEVSILELIEIAKGTKINLSIINLIERSKEPNLDEDKKKLQNLLIQYKNSPKISPISEEQNKIFIKLKSLQNKIQDQKNLILDNINQANKSNFLNGLSIENIQKNLSTDQAIVSYYGLLTIVITNKNIYLKYLLPNDEFWENGIREDLIKKIHNSNKPNNNTVPDFDIESSKKLHELIIKPIKYLINNKKELFIVPDKALLSLPFEVLIDSNEELIIKKDYKNINWFGKKYIISYYPTVFSFHNLNQIEFKQANIDFLGFGDPKFKTEKNIKTAKVDYVKLMQRGIADADEIRKMSELPETKDELMFIANIFKDKSKLYLGKEFNEDTVKSINLKDYKYISFATHAVIANQLNDIAEPGLILTPPKKSTKENDGILTTSEIEKLNLQSDIVILSACNTASEDGTSNAEGLSGLASAFFQAGTKSLMVTHWDVETNSAVQLTTGTFDKMKKTKNLAKALQQTKIEMINNEKTSHPIYWAPFVLIGNVNQSIN